MSRTVKDITGQAFGLLTVTEESGRCANGQATWRCRCKCGKEVIVRGYDLRKGITTSCGGVGCKAQAKNMIKKDCFAYVARDGRHLCSALTEAFCLKENCKFYAPVQKVCGECENKDCDRCLTVSYQKQLEKEKQNA